MDIQFRMWREWLNPVERQFVFLSLLLIAVSSALGLYLPKLAGQFLDKISLEDDEGALVTLIVCITLNQGLWGLGSLCLNFIGERAALRLRTRIFAALVRKPQSYFDSTPRQKMLQATLADVDAIRTIVSVLIGLLTDRFVTVIGGFIAILYVSQLLAFYTVLIAPVIALTLSFTGERVVYPLEQEARDRIVDVSEAADESFSNATIVRSFGMEKAVANRFQGPALKRFLADRKAVLGLTVFRGAILYIAGMALLLACWYGRKMVRDEKSLAAGDLIAFLVYAVQIAVSMANSTRESALIAVGVGCAKSTIRLLDDEETQDSLETELAMQLQANGSTYQNKPCEEIKFDNVLFGYPTEGRSDIVLKGINLTLRRGRSIALVGPSGAGKSSVIALLEKFYSPTEGRILVDDVDLTTINTRTWRNRIGLVTQDACLFAGSIAENIALGKPDSPASKKEIERAATLANVMEFARDLPLGLQTQVGIRGGHLSSGQRQRVAVARAILRDPHVLLLDEHTSQLDTASEKLVQDSMDEMMKGRVSLIIAHRLQTARRAGEICVMVQGRIVETGTHDQLVNKPDGAYQALWIAQQSKQE
jgi:ABC-type multidrug transport system fused ATPase/permease subunit